MKSDNLLYKWGFVDSQSVTIVRGFLSPLAWIEANWLSNVKTELVITIVPTRKLILMEKFVQILMDRRRFITFFLLLGIVSKILVFSGCMKSK